MADATALFARAEEVFHAALEIDEAERAVFLERSCAGDSAVRAQVDAMLAGHEQVAPSFLEPHSPHALIGQRVGQFTLLRLIGSGGMGAVYEALQDQPRRSVALKVVRGIAGAGRDARRLELEAELMARLRHPNVAQIHAAGLLESPAGPLAWFAMELVPEARNLLEYARELDLRSRLDLFDAVCRAVGHGHECGVVHCDLKPDNILLDAEGTPKVIDFGVARAAGTEASAAALRERAGGILGTLSYMSPEQANPETGAPGVPSDVYSLGVVLYELVLGTRPLALEGRPVTEALSILRDEQPMRPSAVRPGISRDLEAILLKALAKDPADRYATVHALADDIRRWRRCAPIQARPAGPARRALLFVRRHGLLVGSLSGVFLALLAASVVSTAFGIRATRAAEAETRARVHADRVRAALENMFVGARPSTALGRTVSVREILDDAAFSSERELADAPGALADVLTTIGGTLVELGEYQRAEEVLGRARGLAEGLGDEKLLLRLRIALGQCLLHRGRYAEAEAELRQVVDATAGASGEAARTHVSALLRLAGLLNAAQRPGEARAALEEGLGLCEQLGQQADEERALILLTLGELANKERDWTRAEELQRGALAIHERILPPDHPALASTRNSLASTLFERGELAQAAEQWQAALSSYERVLDPAHPDLSAVIGNLALLHQRRQELDQAQALFERAIELRRTALGDAHPRLAHTLSSYAMLKLQKGEFDRARELAHEAIEVRQRALSNDGRPEIDEDLARDLGTLAVIERQAGRPQEAEPVLVQALAIQREAMAAGHPDIAQTLTLLGTVRVDLGRPAEAEDLLREALDIRSARFPGHWLVANTQSALGGCLLALDRPEEAEAPLAEAVPVLVKALGKDDFRTQDALKRAIQAAERLGKPEQAVELGLLLGSK